MIDQTYEFLAPRWFDFINEETDEEARRAGLWFESALRCAPSQSNQKVFVSLLLCENEENNDYLSMWLESESRTPRVSESYNANEKDDGSSCLTSTNPSYLISLSSRSQNQNRPILKKKICPLIFFLIVFIYSQLNLD